MAIPLKYNSGWRWNDPRLVWNGFAPENPNIHKTMPSDNLISATLTDADKAAVLAAIATIKTKLPFLLNLTQQERKELASIGSKSLGFDEQCASYMATNPELIPSYVDPVEVAKDRALRTQLGDILRPLMEVAEGVQDTYKVAAHEIYMADLSFYQNVHQATRRGVVGADTIYKELSQRFPGRPKKQSPPPTPPANP